MIEQNGVISRKIYSPEKQFKVIMLLRGLNLPYSMTQSIRKDKKAVLYVEFKREDIEESIKFLKELLK